MGHEITSVMRQVELYSSYRTIHKIEHGLTLFQCTCTGEAENEPKKRLAHTHISCFYPKCHSSDFIPGSPPLFSCILKRLGEHTCMGTCMYGNAHVWEQGSTILVHSDKQDSQYLVPILMVYLESQFLLQWLCGLLVLWLLLLMMTVLVDLRM